MKFPNYFQLPHREENPCGIGQQIEDIGDAPAEEVVDFLAQARRNREARIDQSQKIAHGHVEQFIESGNLQDEIPSASVRRYAFSASRY